MQTSQNVRGENERLLSLCESGGSAGQKDQGRLVQIQGVFFFLLWQKPGNTRSTRRTRKALASFTCKSTRRKPTLYIHRIKETRSNTKILTDNYIQQTDWQWRANRNTLETQVLIYGQSTHDWLGLNKTQVNNICKWQGETRQVAANRKHSDITTKQKVHKCKLKLELRRYISKICKETQLYCKTPSITKKQGTQQENTTLIVKNRSVGTFFSAPRFTLSLRANRGMFNVIKIQIRYCHIL